MCLGRLYIGIKLYGGITFAGTHETVGHAVDRERAAQRERLLGPMAHIVVVEMVGHAPTVGVGIYAHQRIGGSAQAVALSCRLYRCREGNHGDGQKSYHLISPECQLMLEGGRLSRPHSLLGLGPMVSSSTPPAISSSWVNQLRSSVLPFRRALWIYLFSLE